MYKQRKFLYWILILILLWVCCLSAGCGKTKPTDVDTDSQQGAEQTEQTERTIVDNAGRKLTIPTEVNKVFSINPTGTILVYTINPDKLVGWNDEFRPGVKKFVDEKYLKLPVLGGWHGSSTCNIEELLREDPDIIISILALNDSNIELANKIQEQTNIPVVFIDADLDKIDKAYEVAGELMNEEEVTSKLAKYCRETLDDIAKKSGQVSDEQRIRVYYAEGPKGLSTEPPGSLHTQVLDMVGGANIAKVEEAGGRAGMVEVSPEQVLQWDPDLILCWNAEEQGGYFEGIFSDPNWKNISAVKNKNIYEIPCAPFNWFDRPPSVSRALGLKWMGSLLYPEIYNYDMTQETKEFYDMFFHYKLTDEETAELLKNAM